MTIAGRSLQFANCAISCIGYFQLRDYVLFSVPECGKGSTVAPDQIPPNSDARQTGHSTINAPRW